MLARSWLEARHKLASAWPDLDYICATIRLELGPNLGSSRRVPPWDRATFPAQPGHFLVWAAQDVARKSPRGAQVLKEKCVPD